MIALIYLLVSLHLTMVCTSLYIHRGMTHRSVEFAPPLQHFFRFWIWLTDGVVVKEWVATHRKHHRFTDVEGDPHAPIVFGIKRVAWDGFFYCTLNRFRSYAPPLEVNTYGKGCPDDWLERNIYTPHNRLGFLVLMFINVLLFGRIGLAIWVIQLIWTPLVSGSLITGVLHWRGGYKHPDSKDNARNFPFLGFLMVGDEYHSNHHTDPANPKMSHYWYEFDLGWLYLKVFERLKLVKIIGTTIKGE